MTTGALEAIDRILNRGGEPGDVLRAVVGALVERGPCTWASIRLAGETEATTAEAGEAAADRDRRVELPIVYRGERVAVLAVDGCDDRAFLDRVALVVSAACVLSPGRLHATALTTTEELP